MCTDLCRGEYRQQTNSIKSLFSCAPYTAPTLACIAAGIETLPARPDKFAVESVNDTAIRVEWAGAGAGAGAAPLPATYTVNITYLQFLSPVFSVRVDTSRAAEVYPPHSALHTVSASKAELVVAGLEKFSLYEVQMWAVNSAGRSLPTYSVRVVTHLEGEEAGPGPVETPDIPDIRQCCVNKNVSHAT